MCQRRVSGLSLASSEGRKALDMWLKSAGTRGDEGNGGYG
jgi:hypothetical protein